MLRFNYIQVLVLVVTKLLPACDYYLPYKVQFFLVAFVKMFRILLYLIVVTLFSGLFNSIFDNGLC